MQSLQSNSTHANYLINSTANSYARSSENLGGSGWGNVPETKVFYTHNSTYFLVFLPVKIVYSRRGAPRHSDVRPTASPGGDSRVRSDRKNDFNK